MRALAWCVLTLGLMGCHSGPRWCMRDCDTPSRFDDRPGLESAPPPATPAPAQPGEGPALKPPPQPAQRERVPYESSSRARGWFGNRPVQASRAKPTTQSTQTARRSTSPTATAKTTAHDDSVKQLLADLEKIKREKTSLETKLTEDSAKQTQQRLELEARLALIQEQMRQQSALQQVMYQQQAPTMSRPMTNYGGPMINSGAPSPSVPMPFSSSTQTYAPQTYAPQSQAVPAWNNSAPNWNVPAAPQQQQVEQWPYSPQRR